jgi:putative acetyltransferase
MTDSIDRAVEIEALAVDSAESIIAAARNLLLEYGRFVVAQPGAARFCFGSLEKEAERLPLSYLEQGGGCLVAQARNEPAGFIAWRSLPADVAPDAWEMKRLWVRPVARGLGLGRTLSTAVLDRARQASRKAVYLDTAPGSMAAAYRMYLDLGFNPCSRYNDNPVEGLVFLVKHL